MEVTFAEDMRDGVCEVDGPFIGIVCDTFEEFEVEVVLDVIEDKFLVQSDGVIELILEVEIPRLWQHPIRQSEIL